MPSPELKNNPELVVNCSPHIEIDDHIVRRMWATFFVLIPAGIAGVYFFGINSLYLILTSIITALITELICQKLQGRKITILDGSAMITGLLLAYNLPPGAPLWIAAMGTIFAVAIGKHIFGGLGFNIFNPALIGRAFLMASWPKYMTTWTNTWWQVDAVTTATPLGIIKEKLSYSLPSYWDLFIGNRGGCIGEVCVAALLIGGIYLIIKNYISWQIPFSFIATLGVFSWLFSNEGFLKGDFLFSILAGGVVLGAFFMATDYVTAPLTKKGKVIFGVGCGLLTFLIRRWGGYPEGVSYAILMMNAASPIIDRFSRPKKYGWQKAKVKK
jgi:electron transport complex protein RnfD